MGTFCLQKEERRQSIIHCTVIDRVGGSPTSESMSLSPDLAPPAHAAHSLCSPHWTPLIPSLQPLSLDFSRPSMVPLPQTTSPCALQCSAWAFVVSLFSGSCYVLCSWTTDSWLSLAQTFSCPPPIYLCLDVYRLLVLYMTPRGPLMWSPLGCTPCMTRVPHMFHRTSHHQVLGISFFHWLFLSGRPWQFYFSPQKRHPKSFSAFNLYFPLF